MKFSVLASGSTGNSLYIEAGDLRILVDAGLSGKQLEQRLQLIGITPSMLSAIFVTHEHIDHVKGLGVLSRRYQLPVYMNEKTWASLPSSVGEIAPSLQYVLEAGAILDLENLHIQTIPTSHDAAEPMGYRFDTEHESLAIVTDLGYVSKRITNQVRGVDTLIWESNHDVEMLRMGAYPWNIKRRILGDLGHLSNQDSGEALAEIAQGTGEQIYLAHLSQDNNVVELAHLTVKQILADAGAEVGKDIQLWETYADRPTQLREVRSLVKR